jgi:hypothetical protein
MSTLPKQIAEKLCGCDGDGDARSFAFWTLNGRNVRVKHLATAARLQTVPRENLLDQFFAEAPGQWSRAQ